MDKEPMSIFEIASILWKRKLELIQWMLVTFFCLAAYVFFASKEYKSSIVISPIQDDKNLRFGSFLQAITQSDSLPLNRPEGMAEFIYVLTSPEIGEELLKDSAISSHLFPAEWNGESKTWQPPQTVFHSIRRLVYWMLRYPSYSPPSAFRVSEVLKKAVKIEPVKDSSLVKLVYLNNDREFGSRLLETLFNLTDRYLRKKRIEKTYLSIEHLNKRLQSVENVVHRKSLADLLLFSEQELILLETDQPFSARKLGISRSSDFPVSPDLKKLFIVMIALVTLTWGSWTVFRNRPR